MAWGYLKNGCGLEGKNRRISIFGLAYLLLITLFATQSFAGVDMTIFGPKRYDRIKGPPNVFVDSFQRCNPSDSAILRVHNGDGKSTSITAGQIYVNGNLIIDDHTFKQQTYLYERPITVNQSNELKVELKSSGPTTSFVVVEIIGTNCDSTPPVISAPTPADGSLLKNPRPTISASYADEANGSGINTASVSMLVDGADVTASSTVGAAGISYTPSSDLPDKTHTVTLTVADRGTNSSSLTWQFTTDTVAPSFGNITPAPGSFLNTPVITISGAIDDPLAKVTLNGLPATISSGRFTLEGFQLHEGSNSINIVAVDKAGNEASGIFILNLDTVSPVIDILQPVNRLLTNKAQVTVSGKVSDDVTLVTVNGVKAEVTGTDYTVPYTLKEGHNTLTAVATDRANNTGSYSVEVTLDSIAPDKPVLAKLGTPTNVATATINGTAEPASTVKVSRAGALVGTVTADAAGNFSVPNVHLNEGDNTFTATATDAALNESQVSDPVTAVLDTAAPVVKITSHNDGQFLNTPTVTVSGTLDDATAKVTVNGQPATATAGGFQFPGFALVEGPNTVSAHAVDPATNSGNDSITINLDTIAPVVTITSPVNNFLTNKSQVTVTGTISEEYTTVTVNGLAAKVEGKEFSLTYNLVEGQNTITVIAADRAANPGNAIVFGKLDSIPPAKPVIDKLKTPTNIPSVAVSGTAEAGSSVKISRNGALLNTVTADAAGRFTLANVTLNEGDNVFTATATDPAQNESPVSDPVSAVLDTVLPVVKITSHTEGQFINTPSVTVFGTLDDPTASVTVNGKAAAAKVGGFELTEVTLVEGQNRVVARATDPATNVGTDGITVNLDTIVPVVTITSPANNLLTNNKQVTVTGTISEEYTTVTVNGIAAKVEGKEYTLTYNLVEGQNNITVIATDRAQNKGTASIVVNLDSIPPVKPVLEKLKTPTNVPVIVVNGAAEAGSSVKISRGGVVLNTVTADSTGRFTLANVTLNEGDNVFTATATDAAQNESQVSDPVSAVLDTAAPVVKITSHTNGQFLNTPTITVSGTLDDPTAEVTVNGRPAEKTSGGFSLAGVTLAELANTLTVRAVDPAGNVGTDSITVNLDTVPPLITITYPVANSFLNTPAITVAGGTNEPVTEVTVNGAAAKLEGQSFTLPVTLAEGVNSYTVRAKDRAGNEGSIIVPVNLDTVAPVVTVIAPVNGLLTNQAPVTISGSLSEEFTKVTVNKIPAAVTGNTFTLAYTLAEGDNTLLVEASDRAGNPGNSSVTVKLDSTAPLPPILDPIKTPTNVATVSIKGKAEANTTVEISAGGAVIGSVVADAQQNFVLDNVALTEGENSFSATATDSAGNESGASTVKVVLDITPPVITVTAPAADSFLNTPQISVTGSVNETLQTLTVNGQAVTPNGTEFQQSITLNQGRNTVAIVATDLAGNVGTKDVPVNLDTTAPVVTITAPKSGASTNSKMVTITGTVNEDFTTATINGNPVTVANQAFSFDYSMQEGDNTLTVEATDRAGNKGSASVTRTLDTQLPTISVVAPAEAAAGANVTILVNARDNAILDLAELKADGVAIWSATTGPFASEPVSYSLSPTLKTGSDVQLVLRGVDYVGNQATATASIKITQSADGPGYIQGKVLNDQRGLLLAGAEVTITDAKGATTVVTTAEDGGYFAEVAAGSALVKAAKAGFTAVERMVTILPEQKTTVLDARLTPVSMKVNLVDSTGAQIKIPLGVGSAPSAEIAVPAGVLGVQGDLRFTQLGNQGLPGVLPAGWSPIAAADLTLYDPSAGTPVQNPPSLQATVRFPAPQAAALRADSVVVLASYDPASHLWIANGTAVPATDGSSVSAAIDTVGKYALLVADPAPNAPPAAEQGKALTPAATAAVNFDLTTAAGKVVPQASPPAAGLRAAGELVLTATAGADPAPQFTSGVVVASRVTERFDLHSGDRVEPPVYNQDLVLYRVPCATNIGQGALTEAVPAGLRATFPVSPSRDDLTIVDLLLGKVGIEILRPDAAADNGGVMVGADGARLLDGDGNVLVIPPGALSQTVPVVTKNAQPAAGAVGNDFTLLKAVELNLTYQTLASPATLSIPMPLGVDPALPIIVAKAVDVRGTTKLKLVALGKSVGSLLSSDTTASGLALPGITTSGTFYFLQGNVALGFVSGTVTDPSGTPFKGALVKTDAGSLVDLSAPSGGYLVAVPAGSFTATATNLDTADQGSAAGTITAANQSLIANLNMQRVLPQVAKISPVDGEQNVQPSVQVVVTFSKKMDKSSISTTTMKLTKADGTAVNGVISFNIDGTAATFYPEAAFESEGNYRVTMDASIRDVQGYQLGQTVTSTFTVRKTTPPVMPAAGAVSGTFPDADGFITVTGTQGSADPANTVLLINDTTGEVVSVTPQPDGSFNGRVSGQLGDEIKVMLMDNSGNQTLISYITFRGPDGKYLVTAKGGKIEGEGGSVLEIPEGALFGPTVVKISPITVENLAHPPQEGASFVAGVNIDTGGVPFQKEVQFSVPLPEGYQTDKTPFVAKPDTLVNADGTVENVFVIVDSAKVVDGRLSTACEPFGGVMTPGPMAFFQFATLYPAIVSGYTYRDMDEDGTYSPGDLPVKNAVIRAPGAYNYIAYSNSKGFYATFSSTMANIGLPCKDYPVTAINPQNMFRQTITTTICEPPYNLRRINFKLAEKSGGFPDKTAPITSLNLMIAPGQPPEAKFTAGTVPVGTDIQIPISVIDQAMGSVTLTVQGPGVDSPQPVQVNQDGFTIHSTLTADSPAIYRYSYVASFSAPFAGSTSAYFRPSQAGLYTFVVEAKDAEGNRSRTQKQIRAVEAGSTPGGIDGPPTVDKMTPASGAEEVGVNTSVTVYFSEPVQNVTGDTFMLKDTTTGETVPATIISGIENGRMKVELSPRGNLSFGRKYEVTMTQGVTDSNPNPSFNNTTMALKDAVTATFTTKNLKAYDLPASGQTQGSRDIAVYADPETETVYTYLSTMYKGWSAADVTEPTEPALRYTQNINQYNFRYLAVEPDRKIVGITDSVFGLQYGYVRFYDLSSAPGAPSRIGQERLSEEYSGVPSRLVLSGKYAYVANLMVGLQVVDIDIARQNVSSGRMSSGEAIVGVLDMIGDHNTQPWDITLYGTGKGLLTTSKGDLMTLDLSNPQAPQKVATFHPSGYGATRVAAAAGYTYLDTNDSYQTIDLAVTGGGGKINTVDVSDPYNPVVMASVKNEQQQDVNVLANEIAISKEAGLAFVTTSSSLLVIDIKNPQSPKLLNEVQVLSNDDGTQVQLGANYGVVEKEGFLYMANDLQGLKVVQFVARPVDILAIKPIEIDDFGMSMDDGRISYRVNDNNFQILSAEVNIYKDGVKILTLPSTTEHLATVTIPFHTSFDVNARYHAEVVLNGNTADPVISYRKRIPVFKVKVDIDSVNKVLVSKDWLTINKLEVKYSIKPWNYTAANAKVVLVNDVGDTQSVAGHVSGTGTVAFDKGIQLKKDAKYEVYVVVNAGTPTEKKSERRTVEFADLMGVEVRDFYNPCNRVPDKFHPKRTRFAVAADKSQVSKINFWYDNQPLDHKFGPMVWTLSQDNTVLKSGTVGSVDQPIPVEVAGLLTITLYQDANGNGVVDSGDSKLNDYTFRSLIYDYAADVNTLQTGSFLTGGVWPQVTHTFLDLFLNNGNVPTMELPARQTMILDATNEDQINKLSHFVGADFDVNNNCNATIPLYEFASTSTVSAKIANSGTFKDVVQAIVEENKAILLQNYNSGVNITTIPGSKELDFKNNYIGPDLWYGIGDSSFSHVTIQAQVDNVDGLLKVSRVAVSGVVDDLYDFDLLAMKPADTAARVQYGYGRTGVLGPAGGIYWNTFHINSYVDISPVTLN